MVTISCVLILAAVAVPKMQGYLLQTRLEAAKPYLAQIAAKQRMAKITSGVYCCQGYNLDEDTLVAGLGLNLADTGDFCFVFICRSLAFCSQASGPGFITTVPDPASQPDFEVWAILQSATGSQAQGPGGTACAPAAGKAIPTGWVNASGSGRAGRAGQTVALRYAPPVNGVSQTGAYHAVTFSWRDGASISDAMFP